jgi:hypothetical protein
MQVGNLVALDVEVALGELASLGLWPVQDDAANVINASERPTKITLLPEPTSCMRNDSPRFWCQNSSI